ISFSGSVAQAGRAFGIKIHRYEVNGEAHFANTADPSIPAALGGIVVGVAGLNDFRMSPLHVWAQASPNVAEPQFNSGGGHYLAPDDFATIYNLTPLYSAGFDGSGVKIAVLGQSAINLSDIQSFRRRYNLPVKEGLNIR